MFLTDLLLSISFWGLTTVLIVSLVATFLVALVLRRVFRGQTRAKIKAANRFLGQAKERLSLTSLRKRFERFVSYLFARYGYAPKNSLGQAFRAAMESLRLYTGSSDYRYKLPLYLMVGQEASGKNALLKSVKIPLPIERHPDMPDEASCDFWFFDSAVVVKLDGHLLIEKNAEASYKEEWRLFLYMLLNSRPGKPLDGIILCIPLEELLTRNEKSITLRASYLHDKFRELQRILGLRMPLYVVVTQVDKVAGFTQFCQTIPPENRDDMFGWSSPYALDTPYQDSWVDDAFTNVEERLLKLQQTLWVRGTPLEHKEGVVFFPHTFHDMKEPLRVYLRHLFGEAAVSSGLVLRGLFFTGSGGVDLGQVHNPVQQDLQDALYTAIQPAGEGHVEEETGVAQGRLAGLPSVQEKTVYFSTGLFRDKIFAEQGLATSLVRYRFSRDYRVRALQFSVLLVGFLSTAGLFEAYKKIMDVKRSLMPRLDDIGHVMQRALTQERYRNLDHTFFQKQAASLLPAISEFDTDGLHAWLIPFSWFNPLDFKLQKVIELAYHYVIFRAIAQKLEEGIKKLVQGKEDEPIVEASKEGNITFTDTASYRELARYINKLALHESMLEKYNNLKNTESTEEFAFLVRHLFGYRLPSYLDERSATFHQSFVNAAQSIQTMGFFMYEDAAARQYDILKDQFVSRSFDIKVLLPTLERLVGQLRRFAQGARAYSVEHLKQLVATLSKTIDFFTSPESGWLLKRGFDVGETFDHFLGKLAMLNILPSESADVLYGKCEEGFARLRGTLAAYSTDVTGKLFSLMPDGTLRLSSAVQHLQGTLNLLLTQPFMSSSYRTGALEKQTAKRRILWQSRMLRKASDLVERFDTFFASRLNDLSADAKLFLQDICLEVLEKNLRGTIHSAQDVRLVESNTAVLAPEEISVEAAQNLKSVMPEMAALLKALKKYNFLTLHDELRSVLQEQALLLLETVDNLYEEEGPYEPRTDVIRSWTGDPRQVLAAFGASSTHDLKNYLTAQRQRLQYLSNDCAQPAVDVLKLVYTSPSAHLPNLMMKWSDIGIQLAAYTRKTANTLQMLEEFVLNTLPALRLESCSVVLQLAKNPAGIDYFLDRINDIRTQFVKQCYSASDRAAKAAYTQLLTYFNTNLAGRYPFVPKGFDGKEEVSLDDLKGFFALFDQKSSYVREMLRNNIQKKPYYQSALRFMVMLEKARPFFRLFVNTMGRGEVSAIPLEATFRVNKNREKNGAHLLSWSLLSEGKTYLAEDKKAKWWWHIGQPIKLGFRWALGSPYRPVPSPKLPGLHVEPLQATLTYHGNWGLLRLLQTHRARRADGEPLDDGAKRLHFSIPMALKDAMYPQQMGQDILPVPGASEMLVLMDLKLVKGPEGAALDMPTEFPHIAPSLDESEGKKASKSQPRPGPVCELPVLPSA